MGVDVKIKSGWCSEYMYDEQEMSLLHELNVGELFLAWLIIMAPRHYYGQDHREEKIASQIDISISYQMDEKSLLFSRVLVKYCQSIALQNYEKLFFL